MRDRFEWAVAGLVVAVAGAAVVGAAVFVGLPLADYIRLWWGIALW